MLTLTHQHLPGMSVIAVIGEVDRNSSDRLAGYIGEVHRPGDHVVIDLAELSFMDSSGLRVLLDCARRCADGGADLHLAAAHGAPARLLAVTGVDRRLSMYATAEEAITAVLSARGNG
jgi:anti-sigma B factor antagonist